MLQKTFSSVLLVALLQSVAAAAPISARDCQARLLDIANSRMSGDDTLVLNDCALAGLISSTDIERAYERAKAARS